MAIALTQTKDEMLFVNYSRRGNRLDDEQIMASNVDVALLVAGLDNDFNLRRIERYLAVAAASGIKPVVVLNKADLADDIDSRLVAVDAVAPGVAIVAVSAWTGQGLDELRRHLVPGATAAILGSSGVGKSTLVNQLLGEERQRVQEVRVSDGRGRHTTTCRELSPLPRGGAIIDTPGMRELQLWAGQGSLDSAFDDIAELALQCRFGDCTHIVEDGCAVQAAILDGGLDGERWQSYQKLRAEVAWHERKTDVSAALAERRRWKKIHKQMRSHKDRW